MADEEQKVVIYVYDLTHGMAAQFSEGLIGKRIEGVWHTAVVVYGKEFFYGGGIQSTDPGCSMAGQPHQVIPIGNTNIPREIFLEFCREVSPRFSPATYSLLKWNCNNFTQEACNFLTGKDIPNWITGLPEEFVRTPMGQMLRPMIETWENSMKQNMANMSIDQMGGGGGGWAPVMGGAGSERIGGPVASSSSSSQSPPVSSSSSSSAAAGAGEKADESKEAAAEPDPNHAHTKLGLKSITTSPQTMSDDKTNAYVKMALAKKLDKDYALTPSEIEILKSAEAFCTPNNSKALPDGLTKLFERTLLEWPLQHLLPLVAVFRTLIASSTPFSEYFGATPGGLAVVHSLIARVGLSNAEEEEEEGSGGVDAGLRMLVLCSAVNLFAPISTAHRQQLCRDDALISAALGGLSAASQSAAAVRTSAAALAFNCCLSLPKRCDDEVVHLATALSERVNSEKAKAPRYRELMALLHLMYCNDEVVGLLTALEFSVSTDAAEVAVSPKIRAVVEDIERVMASMS